MAALLKSPLVSSLTTLRIGGCSRLSEKALHALFRNMDSQLVELVSGVSLCGACSLC